MFFDLLIKVHRSILRCRWHWLLISDERLHSKQRDPGNETMEERLIHCYEGHFVFFWWTESLIIWLMIGYSLNILRGHITVSGHGVSQEDMKWEQWIMDYEVKGGQIRKKKNLKPWLEGQLHRDVNIKPQQRQESVRKQKCWYHPLKLLHLLCKCDLNNNL